MHELSLACSVVELVEREMRRHGCGRLCAIEMTVGGLSGIDDDAFSYSLRMVLERTPFAGVRVEIHRVDPAARCDDCGETFRPASLYTPCPRCGSYAARLVSGQEFRLSSLIVEEGKE